MYPLIERTASVNVRPRLALIQKIYASRQPLQIAYPAIQKQLSAQSAVNRIIYQ